MTESPQLGDISSIEEQGGSGIVDQGHVTLNRILRLSLILGGVKVIGQGSSEWSFVYAWAYICSRITQPSDAYNMTFDI